MKGDGLNNHYNVISGIPLYLYLMLVMFDLEETNVNKEQRETYILCEIDGAYVILYTAEQYSNYVYLSLIS